jgi:hypothetical protein
MLEKGEKGGIKVKGGGGSRRGGWRDIFVEDKGGVD